LLLAIVATLLLIAAMALAWAEVLETNAAIFDVSTATFADKFELVEDS
jgi:hypothetical protein